MRYLEYETVISCPNCDSDVDVTVTGSGTYVLNCTNCEHYEERDGFYAD